MTDTHKITTLVLTKEQQETILEILEVKSPYFCEYCKKPLSIPCNIMPRFENTKEKGSTILMCSSDLCKVEYIAFECPNNVEFVTEEKKK